MTTFVAIDFETANHDRDSACQVGLVRVERGSIVQRRTLLLRPPSPRFTFTHIHGITWDDARHAPTFAQAWPSIASMLGGAAFLAAHNAPFDSSVLEACCERAGLASPGLPFVCTVMLARRTWGVYPTKLPDVARHLGLALRHHDAASDAEACARIVLAASKSAPLPPLPRGSKRTR